jgi:epoxyqueuosine reductase QueG
VQELEAVFPNHGVATWGAADVSEALGVPGPVTAIVFGLRYDDGAIAALPSEERISADRALLSDKTRQIYAEIKAHFRACVPDAIVATLDEASNLLPGLPVSLNQKILAAYCGMGWIGRSSLLIHPRFGPRLRLGTLLVDQKIDSGVQAAEIKCGTCTACGAACPVGAIAGTRLAVAGLSVFCIDRDRCRQHTNAGTDKAVFCGLCMKACPIGGKDNAVRSSVYV